MVACHIPALSIMVTAAGVMLKCWMHDFMGQDACKFCRDLLLFLLKLFLKLAVCPQSELD